MYEVKYRIDGGKTLFVECVKTQKNLIDYVIFLDSMEREIVSITQTEGADEKWKMD